MKKGFQGSAIEIRQRLGLDRKERKRAWKGGNNRKKKMPKGSKIGGEEKVPSPERR